MLRQRKVLSFTKDNLLQEEIEEKGHKQQKTKSNDKFLAVVSLATELGLSISLPIAGGAFLGHFLDGKFNSAPQMTLSGIFLGILIGIANIYTLMNKVKAD